MANEVTVNVSLQVRKGNLVYRSQPTVFRADMDGTKGPSPGAITVTPLGTSVDFSELTTPGFCRLENLDTVNYVEYGILDNLGSVFYPLGELLPGEITVIRLSRNIGESYPTTGTGTSASVNSLHFKSNTDDVVVVVEAFEK